MHGQETMKFEDVSNALMNYEIRHNDNNCDNTSEALFVRGRSSNRRSFSSRKKVSLDLEDIPKIEKVWKRMNVLMIFLILL